MGARNKALLAMEALLDGEAEAITRVAVEKAKEGDATALRLCLERILPPRKDRPVSFSLPQLGTVTDAPAATAAIVAAVAAADITNRRIRARPAGRYLCPCGRSVGFGQTSAGDRGEDGQMRAREMHYKLDKLSVPSEDDEHTCPDISLLSPEDQDWVDEMFEKFAQVKMGRRAS